MRSDSGAGFRFIFAKTKTAFRNLSSFSRARKPNNLLALAALTLVTAVDVACASKLGAEKGSRKTAVMDCSERSVFPQGLQAARGAARDFAVPEDMRTPPPLRPWAAVQASS
jgi:hypothetical protein